MINWVKNQDYLDFKHGVVDADLMIQEINEDWFSDDCAFCQSYIDYDSNPLCSRCPIVLNHFASCENKQSIWWKVDRSETWTEWLKNAEKMLKLLKKVETLEKRTAVHYRRN